MASLLDMTFLLDMTVLLGMACLQERKGDDPMHEKHTSLVARAGWGKAIGFLFGLIGLFVLAFSLPGTGWPIWLGTLFYFTNLGLLVGILSVDLKHPLLPWKLKWWF